MRARGAPPGSEGRSFDPRGNQLQIDPTTCRNDPSLEPVCRPVLQTDVVVVFVVSQGGSDAHVRAFCS